MSQDAPGLILISSLYHDPVLDQVRGRYNAAATALLTNLCHTRVTVDVGGTPGRDRILLGDHSCDPDRLRAIVVAGMPCVAAHGHSPEDARYLERETFATWMALLRKAECRVLNRPSFDSLPINCPSLQVRTLARRAGIPTINDEVCQGTDVLQRRARGQHVACLDLYMQSAFWLSADSAIDEHRLYSVTSMTAGAEQLLLAYVCGGVSAQWAGSGTSGHVASTDVSHSTLDEASLAARRLAQILSVDYAFLSFSVAAGRPEFCRLYTSWPGGRHDRLVGWTSHALVAALAEA